MTWIKQHYDQFLLIIFSAILLACSGWLFWQARNFAAVFASLKDVPAQRTSIRPPELEVIQQEQEKLAKPDLWEARIVSGRRLPLFVSVPYISKTTTDDNGTQHEELIDPVADHDMIHPPIPNSWLLENKQDLLAPDVLTQDTDGDGFTNLDEYLGKTDPNNKDSHPPYWTKLFLKRFQRIPFRLVFDARNGNTLLVNTLDLDEPTQFLKVGDMVKGTKFKVAKFEEKHAMDGGINRDVSEVTLLNTETNESVVLPKQKEVDSPTTYAVLTYLWTGKDFAVKKNQEFTLKPQDNVKYKCVDLSDTDVVVLKEDENKTLHIKMLPAGK